MVAVGPEVPRAFSFQPMAIDARTAYDRWATQYDTDANDTRDLNGEVLRQQTFLDGDDAVLELGCGTGLNTAWLAAQAGAVTATDVSDEMLARGSCQFSSGLRRMTFHVKRCAGESKSDPSDSRAGRTNPSVASSRFRASAAFTSARSMTIAVLTCPSQRSSTASASS